MSRRNRRRASGAVVAPGGGQEIERLLAKGRVKDAFKQAKLAFRQQATIENRLLLERTYLLRVKDLLSGGMPNAAAEVARAFLDFGVTEAGVLGELAALLPQLGMVEEARRLAPRLESSGAATLLEHSLTDQAVLHPERAATPEAKAGAARIRSALAALDGEQDQQAMELLQEIPRSSPWADWRYFVRGLAAFRRGDGGQAAANWNHLDDGRAAHRIALKLRAVVATATDQSGAAANLDHSLIETAVFGQPVLGRLDRLRRLVDRSNPKHDWKQALPLVASLAATLRGFDPRLAERLTEVLMPPLIDEATEMSYQRARDLLDGFTRVAEPCRLDPNWHRLWALCYEEAADGGDAVKSWKKYIDDLERIAGLAPDECRKMQALVWRHIAMVLAEDAEAEMQPFSDKVSPEQSALLDGAVQALEESLRLDPLRRETHALRISLLNEWAPPERAADARCRLLQAFPDDFETLRELANWHSEKDEPERSLEYLTRARKLRPLDASLIEEEHTALIGLARHRALDRRFDEGRAAFAQAESLHPADANSYGILARRAVFEIKAGDQARAEELIEKAKGVLSDAAPLWLILAIEAERYKLGSSRYGYFNRELTASLKKRKSGETAGQLADLVGSYHAGGVDYSKKDRHLSAVIDYLLATSRTRYEVSDLERVCQFLDIFCREEPLLDQLVRRGLKNFPRSPVFHLLRAEDDLRSLPRHFNFQGIHSRLKKALELAQADTEGRYARLIEPIKRQLAEADRLKEATEAMQHQFGGPGGFPGGLPSFFEMMASMANEEYDEDDAEYDEDDADDGPYDEDFFAEMPFSFSPPRKRKRGRNQ